MVPGPAWAAAHALAGPWCASALPLHDMKSFTFYVGECILAHVHWQISLLPAWQAPSQQVSRDAGQHRCTFAVWPQSDATLKCTVSTEHLLLAPAQGAGSVSFRPVSLQCPCLTRNMSLRSPDARCASFLDTCSTQLDTSAHAVQGIFPPPCEQWMQRSSGGRMPKQQPRQPLLV